MNRDEIEVAEPLMVEVRGRGVILDADLGRLHGVPTERQSEASGGEDGGRG